MILIFCFTSILLTVTPNYATRFQQDDCNGFKICSVLLKEESQDPLQHTKYYVCEKFRLSLYVYMINPNQMLNAIRMVAMCPR